MVLKIFQFLDKDFESCTGSVWTLTIQVCLHKIGASLLEKLTICIYNAGLLREHCMVAIFALVLQLQRLDNDPNIQYYHGIALSTNNLIERMIS